MKLTDIPFQRLVNQQLAVSKCNDPADVVTKLVAMQAQEYAMSKWGIALRLPGWNEQAIEKAINDGSILRTHVLRPTWHFVAPEDIRWLLALSAPRINAFNASMYRKMELDQKIFKKCNAVITKALRGGKHLTRDEIKIILERNKINTEGTIRLACIMMYAELVGVICSGARKGKKFTYALMDERVPAARKKKNALKELTVRYFATRGPATLQDFVWWSGLTVKDAKTGIAALPKKFIKEIINGKEYIFIPSDVPDKIHKTFLLPDYDEYGISYKDRSAIFGEKFNGEQRDGNPVFNKMIVIDGKIGGTWSLNRKTGKVETNIFGKPSLAKDKEIKIAVEKYQRFLKTE